MYRSVIFGASGFIGQHLSKYFGSESQCFDYKTENGISVYCDVRKPIELDIGNESVIYNLAAIHKTPGHEYREYFETNVNGAENICNFARKKNINTIVFTSSIAPYGTWEKEKFEGSLPQPTTAYGISKLLAEEIHKRWQAEMPNDRKLIILRPGVVFGSNEDGNFTRLYNAMKSRKFFYPGRKDTKKAAIYVKDLVSLMAQMPKSEKPGVHIYNTVYTPTITIEEICEIISKTTGVKKPKIILPIKLIKTAAILINGLGKIIRKSFNGIHPDRINKLIISTNINGQKLLDHGYEFHFSFKDAIDDWFNDCNKSGLY